MTEIELEITETVVYRLTVAVEDATADLALAGGNSAEVDDAIDAALAERLRTSDAWAGAEVETRTWEVAG